MHLMDEPSDCLQRVLVKARELREMGEEGKELQDAYYGTEAERQELAYGQPGLSG